MTTGSDGTQWILTGVRDEKGRATPLSQVIHYLPSTGRVRSAPYVGSVLHAVAALGPVADDVTPPRVSIRVPRPTIARALHDHGLTVWVTASEPGEAIASARAGGRHVAWGLEYAEHAGTYRLLVRTNRATIRSLAGRLVHLHLEVRDFAGNTKTVDRSLRLSHGR